MALNFNGNTPLSINYNNNDVLVVKWNGVVVWEKIAQYLAFTATSDGTFTFVSSDRTNRISYSLDSGATWSTESVSVSINVNSGDSVMWKGEMIPQMGAGVGTFGGTASFDATGNILSLEYGDNFNGQTDFSSQAGFDFAYLFQGSNIESAENLKLPVEVLTDNCYDSMFDGCALLTTSPLLSSTTLASYCYINMFNGCASLETAPELLAETLEDYCYQGMFFDCSSLNYIKMVATDISATDCLESWVYGVAASGTFVKSADMTTLPIDSVDGVPEGWTLEDDVINYSKQYFTLVAKSSGTFVFSGSSTTNVISYSTDDGSTWSIAARNVTVNVNSGDSVMWKGEMTPTSVGIGYFYNSTASFDAQGNTMSLLYGDNFKEQTVLKGDYTLKNMFSNSNKIINAENLILPADTLTQYCYNDMFKGCTSLITAPQLQATTLATYCYYAMFMSCTSLTRAPELPASTLVYGCYANMFYSDNRLNYVKMLATNISASQCLYVWVQGVASSGTFVKNTSMTSLPRGSSGIPSNWTVENATE